MKSRVLLGVLASLAALGTACSSQVGVQPHAEPFEVELRARNGDGGPLAGAAWATSGTLLGETGTDGALRLTLRGREGQVMRVAVTCPAGYVAAEPESSIRLAHARRISGVQTQPITVDTLCSRSLRDVVLVVHTERGPALPLLVDGKPAGSTDAEGNAHVLLHVDRSVRKLDVALDTSRRANLFPKNPARSFEMDGRDAILIFTEAFTQGVPPKPRSQAHTKHIPYRVD